MKNEFNNDDWITDIIVGGKKSNSYLTNYKKVLIKQKGNNIRDNETLKNESRYNSPGIKLQKTLKYFR